MASLANLPKLRRTLTDVMEDELYHIPGQNRSNTSSPTLQHALLATTQRFNTSQEFLSIPDSFTEAHNNIMTNPTLIEDEGEDDMLIDEVEEQDDFDNLYTPDTFNIQPFRPFHDYANPNVFNSYNDHLHQTTIIQQDPFQTPFEQPLTVSPRDAHIKLPEELLNADSNNAFFNSNYDPSQLFVWPNESNAKNQIIGPEQLYLDEISDDDEDEEDADEEEDIMETDANNYGFNGESYSPPSSTSNSRGAHDKNNTSPLNMDDMTPLLDNNRIATNADGSATDAHRLLKDKEAAVIEAVAEDDEDDSFVPSLSAGNARVRRKQSAVGSISPDGLHQCQLINPSTHKPCLKQFSRPYDLVRHQETIHASKKKIYRCTLCEDDYNKSGNARLSNKTFSRGDALSRHIRVKHGLTGSEANEAIRIAKENVEYIDVQ